MRPTAGEEAKAVGTGNAEESITDLPVNRHRDSLVRLIETHQVVLVVGETGSGKSTQLPRFLREAGIVSGPRRKLLVTQPRKLAAVSLAARVSDELGVVLGEEVGYNVRFDSRTSKQTEIKFATEGMMLRELLANPTLQGYSSVLVDEAHERTLDADVILCLLRELLGQRPEFRLVISSATLDSEKFAQYFREKAVVYSVEGRTFPVEKLYIPQPVGTDYISLVVGTIEQIHEQDEEGAILVFLPGQAEIEQTKHHLEAEQESSGLSRAEMLILTVHSNMSVQTQTQVFHTSQRGQRKVVLATNIAETSLTIPDVRFVVDTGLAKISQYDSSAGMDTLALSRVSQASADQRAGRAGRTGPGKCYRLYTKKEFQQLEPQTKPEILRANLSQVCLLLLSLGIGDPLRFPWLDSPPADAVIRAMTLLYTLGSLNSDSRLTKLGRVISEFPTDPRWAKAILSYKASGVGNPVVVAAAMTGELGKVYEHQKPKDPEVLFRYRELADERGDLHTLVNIYEAWRAAGYSRQWCKQNYIDLRALKRAQNAVNQLEPLTVKMQGLISLATTPNMTQAIAAGFSMNAAILSLDKQSYVAENQTLYLHPSSVLKWLDNRPPLVLYHELVLTTKEYMRGCMVIEPEVLRRIDPKPLILRSL